MEKFNFFGGGKKNGERNKEMFNPQNSCLEMFLQELGAGGAEPQRAALCVFRA